jgi:hypothetical protein
MKNTISNSKRFILAAAATTLLFGSAAAALGSQQNPQSSSFGFEGTITSPPPTQAATVATPSNGQTFTSIPITVAGLCPKDLLVKVFANNVFVGSAICNNGSYSLQIGLFGGQNDIVVRDYDALDQAGPDSNVVSVTFNDAQFITVASRVTLTSNYARRGADPGQQLDWPIILSGGTPPYALSVDWGDGSSPSLSSQALAGNITVSHTYTSAGVYKVVIKATDSKGSTGFLQLVGVANGQASQSASGTSGGGTTLQVKTNVLWWPIAVLAPLILVAFWLGRRFELFSIREHLEKSREEVQ